MNVLDFVQFFPNVSLCDRALVGLSLLQEADRELQQPTGDRRAPFSNMFAQLY